mmetsp:Transcript_86480/g.245234  ORF Transcript_86480/g.245234 Transcript_86480/m.245234 type:complete len:239 (+) Transcript_86480:534-1250(+)
MFQWTPHCVRPEEVDLRAAAGPHERVRPVVRRAREGGPHRPTAAAHHAGLARDPHLRDDAVGPRPLPRHPGRALHQRRGRDAALRAPEVQDLRRLGERPADVPQVHLLRPPPGAARRAVAGRRVQGRRHEKEPVQQGRHRARRLHFPADPAAGAGAPRRSQPGRRPYDRGLLAPPGRKEKLPLPHAGAGDLRGGPGAHAPRAHGAALHLDRQGADENAENGPERADLTYRLGNLVLIS